MAANASSFDLPPLPDYTLRPLPPLVSWMSDAHIALALPVIAYWVVSGFFHIIDVYDMFPQYRLHTPAEVLKRNHVSRWECFRDVILQQIIQTIFGLVMGQLDDEPTTGKDDFNVAWYAQKIRLAQRAIPVVLSTLGVNPIQLASKVATSQPTIASVLAGGRYAGLVQSAVVGGQEVSLPAFASWELLLAKTLYWYGIPALQFIVGVLLVDTWEYFLHRAMHLNKWLYGKSNNIPLFALPTNNHSHLPLASSQALCPVRIRSALQSPRRRLPLGYPRYWTCISDGWNDC